MRNIVSITAFLFLQTFANPLFSQNMVPSFVTDSLDSYVVKALHDWNIPGLALCIVKDSQVVVLKGYGVIQVNTWDSVDANTLFMIGSNTKAFTATALATLDYEKKLSLDDKVTKWLPEFKLSDRVAGEQATIRDLLCHRLGIESNVDFFTYWKSNLSRKDVIENLRHVEVKYPFRATFQYLNTGFLTAGQIIPQVTGLQWEDYIKKKIFEPLGMTSALTLSRDLPDAPNTAFAHSIVNGKLTVVPYVNCDVTAPAGSISASISDMSKWIMMLLNNGSYNGKEVIPAKAIEATRTPHTIIGRDTPLFNKGQFSLYGLGWFLRDYEGREAVSHGGGLTGFLSNVALVPDEKLGIVVLTNSDQNFTGDNFAGVLRREIMDAYLQLPYRNYSEFSLDEYKKEKAQRDSIDTQMKDSATLNLKTDLPIQSYTGRYFNEVIGTMEIVSEGGKLKVKFFHHPDLYAIFQPLGGNRFYGVFSDPEVGKKVFTCNVKNRKVKSITTIIYDIPYEFIKQK